VTVFAGAGLDRKGQVLEALSDRRPLGGEAVLANGFDLGVTANAQERIRTDHRGIALRNQEVARVAILDLDDLANVTDTFDVAAEENFESHR
jgi:hypothetical protein